jgi:hypothetical protein
MSFSHYLTESETREIERQAVNSNLFCEYSAQKFAF